ncbi:Putative RING-H2 finger protein ATL49 [Striga hermonthica]|uniref:RING-type E3 ubiquitin transferase n=1 Tax=Striga hermonthica TaxID=68872 RepID=A0A9N7MK92_STRHE|nr:Putative RING-H2 finger protein ATL49 [Striga hermonthica]
METSGADSHSLPPPPYLLFLPPPSSPRGFDLNNRVSPSMLLIIIILAVIFFISGVLHLLVRFLLRPPPPLRRDRSSDPVTALEGQLQQLFHLHDGGVDQSFIDSLPIFPYNSIIGVKDPFDCAVCLSEFDPDHNLRLLPKCSHAFHVTCIDTWLLSHSTCPLCRSSLLPDFPSAAAARSPFLLLLESRAHSSRDFLPSDHNQASSSQSTDQKSGEIQIQSKDDENQKFAAGKVVAVKLGKFRNVVGGEGSNGHDNDAGPRRCFSMGSFAYVMDESSSLRVPIRTTPWKKTPVPLMPGHRPAISEFGGGGSCGGFGSSWREFIHGGVENGEKNSFEFGGEVYSSKSSSVSKKESYSVSKIWMRSSGGRDEWSSGGSRRAFSFRFPINNNRWGSEDGDVGSRASLDSEANLRSSFARRTLLWIMGRPSKVVHHSSEASSTDVVIV